MVSCLLKHRHSLLGPPTIDIKPPALNEDWFYLFLSHAVRFEYRIYIWRTQFNCASKPAESWEIHNPMKPCRVTQLDQVPKQHIEVIIERRVGVAEVWVIISWWFHSMLVIFWMYYCNPPWFFRSLLPLNQVHTIDGNCTNEIDVCRLRDYFDLMGQRQRPPRAKRVKDENDVALDAGLVEYCLGDLSNAAEVRPLSIVFTITITRTF